MIEIDIPSYKIIKGKYLVFDYNGTLAVDGFVSKETKDKLDKLEEDIDIYIVTADTYGNVSENMKDTKTKINIISKENGSQDKLKFIKSLGSENCIVVGNGNNDELMLKEASLSIGILGEEGCSSKVIINSDLVVKSISDCLDLLINPNRIIATLRK